MKKFVTVVAIILFLSIAYASIGKTMEWMDKAWETRTINAVGWEGYCADISTVNPKHYLKCEKILKEGREINSTIQED